MARPYQREVDRPVGGVVPLEGFGVSWGGVWSGFLVGMGVLLLFSVLGLAIGISAADLSPGEDLNARGLGIGTAIWSGLSLLVALFLGGMVATRVGIVFDRTAGMIQGMLVWVLAVLGIMYLAGSGISLVASGASGLLGGLTGGAGALAKSASLDDLASGDVDQIMTRLRDPRTARMVAAATGMSAEEAQSTLADIRTRVEAVRDDPAKAAAEARQAFQDVAAKAGSQVESAAAAAQPYASAAIWTTLFAMIISLLAAIGGAMVGRVGAAARAGVE